jgi:hypothetical protein
MRKLNSSFLFTLFLVKLLHLGIALGAPMVIKPGASIQSAVNRNPEGTTFTLKAGIYRQQTVAPKNGNTFIGEPGAIMSGARRLISFTREGRYWVATDQTQQGQATGQCIKNPDGTRYEGCSYPEDLFIDDVPLWRVTTLRAYPNRPDRLYVTRLLCFAISGVNVILLGPNPSSG